MNMKLTNIIANTLKGKQLKIYSVTAYHNITDRLITHYYIHKPTESDMGMYSRDGHWGPTQENELVVDIIGADGSYDPYEGNSFSVEVSIPSERRNNTLFVECDKELELI